MFRWIFHAWVKATSGFVQDLLHIGKMCALELAKGLTLYSLVFSGMSFPCRNNLVVIYCASSIAGKRAAGETGMDDKGDKEKAEIKEMS